LWHYQGDQMGCLEYHPTPWIFVIIISHWNYPNINLFVKLPQTTLKSYCIHVPNLKEIKKYGILYSQFMKNCVIKTRCICILISKIVCEIFFLCLTFDCIRIFSHINLHMEVTIWPENVDLSLYSLCSLSYMK
jgi:hypothetical protein